MNQQNPIIFQKQVSQFQDAEFGSSSEYSQNNMHEGTVPTTRRPLRQSFTQARTSAWSQIEKPAQISFLCLSFVNHQADSAARK
jgi:hypothetical protein